MARTSIKTDARRIARERLAKKAEARRLREQAEEGHITDFEAARTRYRQAEHDMATAVAGLLELGNSTNSVAELTELTESEVRRLRKHAAAPSSESIPAQQDSAKQDSLRPDARPRHHVDDEQSAFAFDSTTQHQPVSTGNTGTRQDE
ncbi:hypothetical protein GCM10010174_81180 [Kutzneria viridogrisea]|uniref:Vacuolar-type H+-ATPase subunit E/Vma4 n=1 Tax=Kutzneria viridogrisea TaxID=47990 RepID=A0ABR6BZ41_9PSEU|nr:vacuolar-type H+-ATPase subunit E/Vma4 [Kutzneria viridogrisea]